MRYLVVLTVVILFAAFAYACRSSIYGVLTSMELYYRLVLARVKGLAGKCPHCHLPRSLKVIEDKIMTVCKKCETGDLVG